MLGKPAIFDTMFGCILVGPVDSSSSINLFTSLLAISPSLDSVLKQFWEVEEVTHIPDVNEKDAFAEDHFQKTCIREVDKSNLDLKKIKKRYDEEEIHTLNPNIYKTDDLLKKSPKSKVMTPKRKIEC